MMSVKNENSSCVSLTRVMSTFKKSRFADEECSEQSVNKRKTELCTASANDEN